MLTSLILPDSSLYYFIWLGEETNPKDGDVQYN